MFNRHSLLTGEITHYYSGDPAFDKETLCTDVERPADAPEEWKPPPVFNHALWVETGDMQHLPVKAGAKPVKFILKRPTPEERALIEDTINDAGMSQASLIAFRLAVVRVEPLPPNTPEFRHDTRKGHRMLCDEWTELLLAHDEGALYGELLRRYAREVSHSSRP